MAKGVDVVGWRSCGKQRELGPKRFALMLKKVARQASTGRSLPPPSMSSVALTPEQRRRQAQNQELREARASFDQGTPECAACPISNGKPYGCYTPVDFPIDADAETALFRYFSAQIADETSAAFGLFRDLVSKAPTQGTAWHTDRGAGGELAELDTPCVREWGILMWKKHLDSAQILGTLFFNQRRIGLISAFATFWEGFLKEARETSPEFERSTTLMQLEALGELYDRVLELASATEGIHILVESDAPASGGTDDARA
jgi:hypothetical protein